MAQADSTLDEGSRAGTRGSQKSERSVLALMIAWAPAEPQRLGEIALFDAHGGTRIVGRGAPAEGNSERVVFYRQRPETLETTAPLTSPGLSREQLRVRAIGDCLHVERIGKCLLEVAGRQVERCTIAPGESLLLKGQLLLYCTKRPRILPKSRNIVIVDGHGFGLPDAQGIVGESQVVWDLRDQLAWMAKVEQHTLLLGESGSGKELCARALHAYSGRANGPFIARNAATIPPGIIDAELFGNVKNYPNPGMTERPGLIGAAHQGTLFLDEIGELGPNLQANLLRVLDAGGEYHNLGGTLAKRSSFRLIGATNRSADVLKHDLAARLVLRLEVPSLNERREDIPFLVRHLLHRALATSPEAVNRFFSTTKDGQSEPNVRAKVIDVALKHTYTTNIRELEAMLWRAMAASTEDFIDWPFDAPRQNEPGDSAEEETMAAPAREFTEEEIRTSLAEHKGNVTRAAKTLGLANRFALYRWMKKYGIEGE
ncbi:MAG TPA: sigma 54-interacting transcriptional regulator [Polyangium sp.]|nr:sigma 54-interacting transcriptional regulator [Polyangium sp.]